MSDIGTDLVFKGHTPGGISCEAFIRAVQRHAAVERKTRDNEYIADYVMSCLIDDALHWSESLSEEVQGNWYLLRPALLEEYSSSSRGLPREAPSVPSAMIPVPAAAPPLVQSALSAPTITSSSDILRGRVQVITPQFFGYLSKQLDDGSSTHPEHFKWHCITTTTAWDACIISGTMTKREVSIRVRELGSFVFAPGDSARSCLAWRKHSLRIKLCSID